MESTATRFYVKNFSLLNDPRVVSYTGTVRRHPHDTRCALSLDCSSSTLPSYADTTAASTECGSTKTSRPAKSNDDGENGGGGNDAIVAQNAARVRLLMDGQGRLLCHSGDVYEGEMTLGMFHGMGKMIYADGAVYEGQWEGNLPHAYGVWESADRRETYVGLWKAGLKDGQGEHIIKDEGTYIGTFRQGIRHGCGRWQEAGPHGQIIDGVFKEGHLEGLATVTFQAHDNDTLVAHFVQGKMHGKATYQQRATGDRFVEMYDHGRCLSGPDAMSKATVIPLDPRYPNINDPRGSTATLVEVNVMFANDRARYRGKRLLRYSGQWRPTGVGQDRDGLRWGKGRLEWKNGDVYEGEFANDHLEGHGVIYYRNRHFEAESIDDAHVMVRDANADEDSDDTDQGSGYTEGSNAWSSGFHGAATLVGEFSLPHITKLKVLRFEGMFHNGLRDGRGALYLSNDDVLEGFWSRGVRHGVFHRSIVNSKWEETFADDSMHIQETADKTTSQYRRQMGGEVTMSAYFAYGEPQTSIAIMQEISAEDDKEYKSHLDRNPDMPGP